MHVVVRAAEKLRNRYGAEADAICAEKLARPLHPVARRNLTEVARTLRSL